MQSPAMKITLTDGQAHETKLIMADFIKYDFKRNALQLPAKEGNENAFLAACVYFALVREGKINADSNFNKFIDSIQSIDPLEVDEAEFQAESGA